MGQRSPSTWVMYFWCIVMSQRNGVPAIEWTPGSRSREENTSLSASVRRTGAFLLVDQGPHDREVPGQKRRSPAVRARARFVFNSAFIISVKEQRQGKPERVRLHALRSPDNGSCIGKPPYHRKRSGSRGMPLFRISKCRCGPVDLPVLPTLAMICPLFTF